MRNVWKYYFSSTEGIIFVVDASDKDRMADAKEEMWGILKDDAASKVPMLVYANKQDLPNALKFDDLVNELGIQENDSTNKKSLVHI